MGDGPKSQLFKKRHQNQQHNQIENNLAYPSLNINGGSCLSADYSTQKAVVSLSPADHPLDHRPHQQSQQQTSDQD
jgi:hypothetical protein